MDIKCVKYRHLWGEKLSVDGTELSFDADGVASGVDALLAQKLIASGGYIEQAPPPEPVTAKKSKAQAATR